MRLLVIRHGESGFAFLTGDTGIHHWLVRGQERYVLKSNFTAHLEE